MTTTELRAQWAQMTQEQRHEQIHYLRGGLPLRFDEAPLPYTFSLDAIAQAVAGMPHVKLEAMPSIICEVIERGNLNNLRPWMLLVLKAEELSEAYWLAMRQGT